MAAKRSSGYFHDVQDWRGSRAIQRMSFAERGVYHEMLNEQYEHGDLPDDAQAVADLIATTSGQAAEVLAAWPVVRVKFVTNERRPDRIYNVRMARTRRDQTRYFRNQQASGSRGGNAKARNRLTDKALASSEPRGSLSEPLANPRDKTGEEETRGDQTRRDRIARMPTVEARSKRPIYTSERFAVFEWQLDELSKILGPHFDEFRLDLFFNDLTLKTRDQGLVIPRGDVWAWLQQQVLAEARRRGLPIATAPKMGKQTTNLSAALERIAAEG